MFLPFVKEMQRFKKLDKNYINKEKLTIKDIKKKKKRWNVL